MGKILVCMVLLISGGLCYIGDVRLLGMGELRLVIEDELNEMTLYDFGGNPAGLLGDVEGSELNVYISGYKQESEYTIYSGFGCPFPYKLQKFMPLDFLPYFKGVPFFHSQPVKLKTINKEGSQAQGIEVCGSGILRRPLNVYYIIREKVITPEISLIYSKEIKPLSFGFRGYGFRSFYRNIHKADLLVLGGEGGIGINFSPFNLGFLLECYYPSFSDDFFLEEEFSGPAVNGGFAVVSDFSKLLKMGIKLGYEWANLSQMVQSEKYGMLSHHGIYGEARFKMELPLIPLVLAGCVEYSRDNPVYKDLEQRELDNRRVDSLVLTPGIGCKTSFIFLGSEFHFNFFTLEDRVNGTISKEHRFGANVGIELSIFGPFKIREGYIFNPGTQITAHTYTTGIGIETLGGIKADISYNYSVKKKKADTHFLSLTDAHFFSFFLKKKY